MTLTDFLLARIAEDEAVAQAEDYESTPHTAACGHRMNEFGYACRCHWPARVLAECEAKRRIVNECLPYATRGTVEYASDDALSGRVLAALALPYADHSDFDPAWRP